MYFPGKDNLINTSTPHAALSVPWYFQWGFGGVKLGLGRSMLIINARLAAIRFYLRLANWLINKMSAMPWENFR